MRYTIERAEGLIEVDVTAEGPGHYRVQLGEGEPQEMHMHVGPTLVHVLLGDRSYSVRRGERGAQQHLHADGFDAVVALLDPRALRRQLAAGGGAGGGGQLIKSPMPGKVVRVLVEEGQTVDAGQGVVIVEAMKMENELRAEDAGVVTSIAVAAGDLVEGQAELVRIDPLPEDAD